MKSLETMSKSPGLRPKFEKTKKVDEKACFYTKEADLNAQDWYNNHFFWNRNRKPKSSILMFFSGSPKVLTFTKSHMRDTPIDLTF